jgi:hypothetical protein
MRKRVLGFPAPRIAESGNAPCAAHCLARPLQRSVIVDTNRFYERVAAELACDRERAEALTFIVFQELRDRLTAKESGDLAAQLPVPLQRVWREGETPERAPHKVHVREFGHETIVARPRAPRSLTCRRA